MTTDIRKLSLLLTTEPEFNIIPTFKLPWIHKDRRITKDRNYSLEGKEYLSNEIELFKPYTNIIEFYP